jgi:hypothetical protein
VVPVTDRNEKVPIGPGFTAGMASTDDVNVVDHQPANAMPYNDTLNAFRFGPIRFAAKPTTTMEGMIRSASIKNLLRDNDGNVIGYDFNYRYLYYVQMRQCKKGEIFIPSGQFCQTCP